MKKKSKQQFRCSDCDRLADEVAAYDYHFVDMTVLLCADCHTARTDQANLDQLIDLLKEIAEVEPLSDKHRRAIEFHLNHLRG